MRRITAFILFTVFLCLSVVAVADVDISGLSYDELIALKDKINLAIWNSSNWQEVVVPQGTWIVGEDIPAGHWTIKCAETSVDSLMLSQCHFKWGFLKKNGGIDTTPSKGGGDVTIYVPNGNSYKNGSITEKDVVLEDGMRVYIRDAYGQAVFSPYSGKPSFGFKWGSEKETNSDTDKQAEANEKSTKSEPEGLDKTDTSALATIAHEDSDNLVSITQKVYEELKNIKVDDLKSDNKGIEGSKRYFIYDYQLLPEDVDWIESRMNKSGSVEHGAVYRKVAYLLKGYDMGLPGLSNYSEDLFGIVTADDSVLAPFVERMEKYVINTGQVLPAVMIEFQKLQSITGEYDFDNWKYTLEIPDVRECAKELEISERALGYVLDVLNEYAAKIQFDSYKCTIEVNPFKK